MYFSYEHLKFRYEPYPIGIARSLMDERAYEDFVEAYPPVELFESHQDMGRPHVKYTLSEKENPKAYYDFVREHSLWRDFHAWVTSDDFVFGVLDALREHHIDLGYDRAELEAKDTWIRRLRGKQPTRLRARFEFSALPAAGGCVLPHTDAPRKIVTLVVSMARKGEWDPAFGGGLDINRTQVESLRFNHINVRAGFDQMEVVDTFAYEPNQAVLFIKTHNSWHSVRPMTGGDSTALRKTLTINILRDK